MTPVDQSGTARLEAAAAAFREALKVCRRERSPLEWAKAQVGLGLALEEIGRFYMGRWLNAPAQMEDGMAYLEEAAAAYRAALEEYTTKAAPNEHDVVQRKLASCLALLKQRRKL